MRNFWVFRSNLKSLEYYHKYTDLTDFINNCHDYYLLFAMWLLKNDYMDSATTWRLTDKPIPDIVFDVDGKTFTQKWVRNFNEVFNYPSPKFSLFRGGFPEYDKLTIANPDHLGTKMYLGTGKRIYPQYGGTYDYYLQEDELDFRDNKPCLPFYKTASPAIFQPIDNTKIKYDICWPSNFTQHKYKGQEFFINVVGHCPKMKKLKIVHCGNKPEMGRKMARKYNVSNIEFVGSVDRPTLNKYLNQSKFGLVLSNRTDGCPRIVTEILCSGTPLILRNITRTLPYYKKKGVVIVKDGNIIPQTMKALPKWKRIRERLKEALETDLSFNKICQKNIEIWLSK
jgi:glycosyltransferase involved in cell wall biosynthesis